MCANICILFCRANSDLDSLAEIKLGPSGLCFFFILDINTAYSKSPSSASHENNCVKMEINRGKVYLLKVKNRGKFTTGKNVYHGVCNCTSFSEEQQKALKPRSQGKHGIFIIMGF